MTPPRLLSIDWDAFMRDPALDDWRPCTWPRQDASAVWYVRAAQGRATSRLSPSWAQLRRRVTLAADARQCVALDHGAILAWLATWPTPGHVLSLDAHHDAGYPADPPWDTGSRWVRDALRAGWTVTVCYPPWRSLTPEPTPPPALAGLSLHVDDGASLGRVDGVFWCRSDPWTHPAFDGTWARMVRAWGASPLPTRPWGTPETRAAVRAIRGVLARRRGHP